MTGVCVCECVSGAFIEATTTDRQTDRHTYTFAFKCSYF